MKISFAAKLIQAFRSIQFKSKGAICFKSGSWYILSPSSELSYAAGYTCTQDDHVSGQANLVSRTSAYAVQRARRNELALTVKCLVRYLISRSLIIRSKVYTT